MNLKRLVRIPLIALSLVAIFSAPNAVAAEITGIGIQMFDLQGTSLYARYCLKGSATVHFQAPINTTSTITDSSGKVFSTKTSQWGSSGAASAPGDCSSFNYAYDEIKSGFIPGSTYTLTVNSEIEGASYSVTKSFTISGGSSAGTESFTNAPAVGGFAVVHPDGHVCGVIVGSIEYFGGNNRTMTSEYMGCPIGARIILQTTQSASGNVAGYHGDGSNGQPGVTYDSTSNSFTVSSNSGSSNSTANTEVVLVIKDGIATDSSGRSFNTGTGVSAETKLSPSQYTNLVSESNRIAKASSQQLVARNKSKELAIQTPGLERCVDWEGSLERGTECSKMAVGSVSESETQTVISRSITNTIIESQKDILVTDSSTAISDSATVTVTVKAKNDYDRDILKISPAEIEGSSKEVIQYSKQIEEKARVVNLLQGVLIRFDAIKGSSSAKQVALPSTARFEEKAISESPIICKIEGNNVVKLQKGLCGFTYTLTSTETGNSFTVRKSITFR